VPPEIGDFAFEFATMRAYGGGTYVTPDVAEAPYRQQTDQNQSFIREQIP